MRHHTQSPQLCWEVNILRLFSLKSMSCCSWLFPSRAWASGLSGGNEDLHSAASLSCLECAPWSGWKGIFKTHGLKWYDEIFYEKWWKVDWMFLNPQNQMKYKWVLVFFTWIYYLLFLTMIWTRGTETLSSTGFKKTKNKKLEIWWNLKYYNF